jgi:phosphotransferase system HPr-like phosphotransfer protein
MNRIDPDAAGGGAWPDRDPALGSQRHPAPLTRSNEELGALADQLVKGFELKWRIGARSAAFIVKTIKEVAWKTQVSCADWTREGKSIMGWLCLGVDLDHEELVFVDGREVNRGAKAGTRFKVVIRGPAARRLGRGLWPRPGAPIPC